MLINPMKDSGVGYSVIATGTGTTYRSKLQSLKTAFDALSTAAKANSAILIDNLALALPRDFSTGVFVRTVVTMPSTTAILEVHSMHLSGYYLLYVSNGNGRDMAGDTSNETIQLIVLD